MLPGLGDIYQDRVAAEDYRRSGIERRTAWDRDQIAKLEKCRGFMVPWIRLGLEAERGRGANTGAHEDFLAMAEDYFSNEIGHLEQRIERAEEE